MSKFNDKLEEVDTSFSTQDTSAGEVDTDSLNTSNISFLTSDTIGNKGFEIDENDFDYTELYSHPDERTLKLEDFIKTDILVEDGKINPQGIRNSVKRHISEAIHNKNLHAALAQSSYEYGPDTEILNDKHFEKIQEVLDKVENNEWKVFQCLNVVVDKKPDGWDPKMLILNKPKGGEICISFGGTDPFLLRDLGADAKLATGYQPQSLKIFDSVIEHILQSAVNHKTGENELKHITITGHSLGGYLAQQMAIKIMNDDRLSGLKIPLKVVTFDSPGVKKSTKNWQAIEDKIHQRTQENLLDVTHFKFVGDNLINSAGANTIPGKEFFIKPEQGKGAYEHSMNIVTSTVGIAAGVAAVMLDMISWMQDFIASHITTHKAEQIAGIDHHTSHLASKDIQSIEKHQTHKEEASLKQGILKGLSAFLHQMSDVCRSGQMSSIKHHSLSNAYSHNAIIPKNKAAIDELTQYGLHYVGNTDLTWQAMKAVHKIGAKKLKEQEIMSKIKQQKSASKEPQILTKDEQPSDMLYTLHQGSQIKIPKTWAEEYFAQLPPKLQGEVKKWNVIAQDKLQTSALSR